MRWIEHQNVKGTRRQRRRRAGAAAVEMALCLPLLLTLLIGTWEVGRMLEVRQFLDVAAREAARQAGSGLLTNSQVSQIAVDYLKNALQDLNGVKTQNLLVTIKVYPSETPTVASNIDVSQAAALDVISVSLSIPYQDIRWVNLPMITAATTITGEASWVSLKDFPFPNTPPQPPQG